METLFDQDYRKWFTSDTHKKLPYSQLIPGLEDRDAPVHEVGETAAFSHILEHEVQYYEGRGYVLGPCDMNVRQNRQWHRVSTATDARKIPSWVEDDGLQFECRAKCVVVVETYGVFRILAQTGIPASEGILLVTGSGIPRAGCRRFLKRLSTEFEIPILLLVDNDTWGYFYFAVLKHGLLQPNEQLEFLAVDDLGYLGLTASDFPDSTDPRRPWRPIWEDRIRAMREYSCFLSDAWNHEFDNFERQQRAMNLVSLLERVDPAQFIRDFVLPRIHAGTYLR